jgi:hypothetical protein
VLQLCCDHDQVAGHPAPLGTHPDPSAGQRVGDEAFHVVATSEEAFRTGGLERRVQRPMATVGECPVEGVGERLGIGEG